MALNKTAFSKRVEQLKRYEDSDTNRESVLPKNASARKVRFSAGCIFLAACAAGDKDEVLNMLNSGGADIDTANVDGLTALHQVTIIIVQFLIAGWPLVRLAKTFASQPIRSSSRVLNAIFSVFFFLGEVFAFCFAFLQATKERKKVETKWLFLEFLKQAKKKYDEKYTNMIVCRMMMEERELAGSAIRLDVEWSAKLLCDKGPARDKHKKYVKRNSLATSCFFFVQPIPKWMSHCHCVCVRAPTCECHKKSLNSQNKKRLANFCCCHQLLFF